MIIFTIILIFAIVFWIYLSSRNTQQISQVQTCWICDESFPKDDIFEVDDIFVCKNHEDTYRNANWTCVEICRVTQDNPEISVGFYEKKRMLYKSGIPCFLKSEYAVGEKNIETIMKLYLREQDKKAFEQRFTPLKS